MLAATTASASTAAEAARHPAEPSAAGAVELTGFVIVLALLGIADNVVRLETF